MCDGVTFNCNLCVCRFITFAEPIEMHYNLIDSVYRDGHTFFVHFQLVHLVFTLNRCACPKYETVRKINEFAGLWIS